MVLNVGFLIFPGVQQLDFTGPYEVFSTAPEIAVHLAWKDLEPVPSATGLAFTPTTTLDDCPALDLLCVPGGTGVNGLMEDEAVLAFVRRQAETARYVTSVCTGSLVLGAAGLLRGRRATSHWMARDFLSAFGAKVTNSRVVRDGPIITAGGVTAGIDFGLTALAELTDRETAERVQLYLEYDPAPPFLAGTPEEAPAAIVAALRTAGAPNRERRVGAVSRAALRLESPP